MRAVLNAGGSRPSRLKDGSRASARHRHGASTPRLKSGAARCGRGVLACRWGVDLARVRGRAGTAFGRGCRVGPVSLRWGWFGPRRPCVVVNPGGGAAAPRASWLQPSSENNFPSAAQIPRGQILFAFRLSTAFRPQAVRPARPRRPDHNKDAMGANLVPPKEFHHGQHRQLHRRQRRLHRHASHPDAQRQGQAGAQRQGDNEKAPDFRLQAASHDIGAAWKKTSEAGRGTSP